MNLAWAIDLLSGVGFLESSHPSGRGGGRLRRPGLANRMLLRLAGPTERPPARRAPVGHGHADPWRSAWPGRRKRPLSSSTPLPPLRACPVRISSSSGLAINLPLKDPWRPAQGARGRGGGATRTAALPGDARARLYRPPEPL